MTATPRIRLVYWNAAEAQERAARLQAAGYEVDFDPLTPAALRALGQDSPGAVVIDLSRLPSQGRDVGLNLRLYKSTRLIPLVFIEGDPDKTSRIREFLPDASYTTWDQINETLQRLLAHPPQNVVVPESSFAGYAGAPLVKKLGIRAGSVVALVGAPTGFENVLGDLPEGVRLQVQAEPPCDLILWFVKTLNELAGDIDRVTAAIGKDGLWIIWPKKVSGVVTDLTQNVVRAAGLAAGLVDYKISAIDETWSGLKFTRRKAK
jgi:hypothetical protein